MLSDTRFSFESGAVTVTCDVDPGNGKPPYQIAPLTFDETSAADPRNVVYVPFFPTCDADQREIIQDGPRPVILYRVAKETRDTRFSNLRKKQVCWVQVEGSAVSNNWDCQLITEAKAAEIRKLKGGEPAANLEGGPWCHSPNEQKPDQFYFGPVTATGRGLDAAICGRSTPDAHFRQLKKKGREGRLWIVKRTSTCLEVWFSDQGSYTTARKRLDDVAKIAKVVAKKPRAETSRKRK